MDKKIRKLFNDTILDKALALYGFRSEEIVDKGGFESYIYEIRHQEDNYILRISHSIHRKIELIQAEIEFIYYLSNNKANVSTPVKSLDQKLVEKIALEDGSYFSATVFTKAEGGHLTPALHNEKLFEKLGYAIGNLHALAVDFQPEHKRYSYFEDPFLLQLETYIPEDKQFLIDKFKILFNKVKNHPRTASNFGLCHTDLHFGNIYVTEDLKLTFFDFDDAMYTHYAFDIAIVFFYDLVQGAMGKDIEFRNEMFKKFYPAFMQGYKRKFSIAKEDVPLIKDYMILRAFDLYAVLNRSFDLSENPRIKVLADYLEDVIVNDTPIFDYDLIEELSV